MGFEEISLTLGYQAVRLTNEHIDVTILPSKGCDVYAIVDPRTGTDLLFKTPWGLQQREGGARSPDSLGHWLRLYPGGWQVILPNGGSENPQYGTTWGFHGEASLVGWQYDRLGDSGLTAEARLFYAPLSLSREMRVDGPSLLITESVTNESPDPVEFMWGHHPAFGAPFLERGCLISVGASTYSADDVAPGTLLEPGSTHRWPLATAIDGSTIDLSVVPGPDEPRDHLGYLTDFHEHFFAITNPHKGLGAAVKWTPTILDHAWFWQEVHSSAGFPWFRRAYVAAIEPNSTIPAQGLQNATEKGGSPVRLQGGQRATVDLELRLFEGRTYVRGITEGRIIQADSAR